DAQFNPEENIGVREYLSEGDIRISRRRNAVRDFYQTWINRTVPYTMEKLSDHERQLVMDAIWEIQNTSCVRFIERTTQIDYITIVKHEGCSSSVGRRGGQQKVILGEGCYVRGVILHELMHALGFWHEHSRPDRDDYIAIVWENIALEHRSNFDKYDTSEIDTLDTVYDYGSIMHYKNNTFAIDRSHVTINATQPIPPGVEMGQRIQLSPTDITKLKRLYRCNITHCADPGIPKNGVRTGSDFGISKTINYSCSAGYTLYGSRGRYCMDNGQWTGNLPSCLPNPPALPGKSGLHYCDFDGQTMCGWTQDSQDDRDWTLNTRSTPSNGTGPVEDHTMGSAEGWYIYLETSSPVSDGNKARLNSPDFDFGPTTTCLAFYYSMNGKNMGALKAYQRMPNNENFTLFYIAGDQGAGWHLATVVTETTSPLKITFEAEAGTGYASDIAVDDVVVGPCDSLMALDKDAVAETLRCNFDADMCDWTEDFVHDVFNWTRTSGRTPTLHTGPDCDPVNCASGKYLYIESSAPRRLHDTARIMTPLLHGDGGRCLLFYYSMNGADIGTLSVHVLRMDGVQFLLWSKTGHQSDSWRYAKIDFDAPRYYKLVFEGEVGANYRGDVAIDNVEVMVGECSDVVRYDCTFENNMCSWENRADDQRDWTRGRGNTPTPYTGPSGDHGTGAGHYLYVESSRVRPGDKARLMSAVISGQFPGYCLQVWYHMYGADMGALRLLTRTVSTGQEQEIWTISRNQGNVWHRKSVFVTSPRQDFRVIFEAVMLGEPSGKGDVAIDDVSIHAGQCES
ncbi:hypothetical protein BaRGS_00024114, partial [Batillaria attramentaria]